MRKKPDRKPPAKGKRKTATRKKPPAKGRPKTTTRKPARTKKKVDANKAAAVVVPRVKRIKKKVGPVGPVGPVKPRDDPRKPHRGKVVVKRRLPGGMTETQMALAIQKAIRFIQRRTEVHARDLAREVGDFLFHDLYRRDVDYIVMRHPGKEDSLRDIARSTGISYWKLFLWLRAAHARWLLRQAGLDPDLHMSKLAEIARLYEHPEEAAAIARWGEAERVGYARFRAAVSYWKRELDEGATLEQLVREPEDPDPDRPRPKPRRKKYKKPDRILLDVLDLMGEWARRTKLKGAARTQALKLVRELRALVEGQS